MFWGLILALPCFVAPMCTRFENQQVSLFIKQSWEKTNPKNRTVSQCSIRCLTDLCFGYKMDSQTMTCLTLETAPREAIIVAPAENTTRLWLKRGHVERVSRVALLHFTNHTVLEYFLSPDPNATFLGIPDFTEIGSFPIHHSFDWGILMCASYSTDCKKWVYGSESWVDGPRMLNMHLETLDYNQVGIINNNLWVIGGFDSGRTFSTTEYYTPEGEWVRGPNLPHPLNKFGVAPISNSQVLIVGGIMNGNYQKDIRLFDLVNGTWSTIDTHPEKVALVACARHTLLSGKDVVFCTGGRCQPPCGTPLGAFRITGVYDIDSGTWTLTPEWDLPIKCVEPRMRVLDGRLLIMGGSFKDGNNNRVLEFKEGETPVWQELESMLINAFMKSAISVEASIWIPD